MLERILLWISLLIFLPCCSNQAQMFSMVESKSKSLTTQNTDERAYMSCMYALFQIIDSTFSDRILKRSSNYLHFRNRIKDWIKDNPDWWDQIDRHLNYCKDLRQKEQLGTDIDDTIPDIRWQLFIKNGVPQNQLTLKSRCARSDTGCTVWMFTWPSSSFDQREIEVSCWSKLDKDYPTEIIPSDSRGFPLAYPMWPFVNYSKFPLADGTTDLWFSVWIPGNQFTSLTLDKGQLSTQIDLYDSSKTILIATGKELSNLQIMRGVLEAVESHDRRYIRAMGYIGFPKVKPGKYSARLTILGAPANEGQNWIEVSVPAGKKISDLLVLDQSMATGDDILPGILRGELGNLYDNPECRLTPKAKFGLYLESTLPGGHSRHLEAWVTLLPIPEVSGRKPTSITVGNSMVVADSLDRPFTNGEWQSSRDQQLLEEIAEVESHSKSSKAITLLREKIDAPEAESVTIRIAPKLKSHLKSGQYLLTVTISDPARQSYFLSARRVIRIASSSAMAF